MEFSSQEYWSGLTFPSLGIFLTQELNLCLLNWQVDSLLLRHKGSMWFISEEKIVDPKWMYIEFYFILSNCSTKWLHKFISRQQCLLYYLLTDGVVKFPKTYQCNGHEMASHYSFIRYFCLLLRLSILSNTYWLSWFPPFWITCLKSLQIFLLDYLFSPIFWSYLYFWILNHQDKYTLHISSLRLGLVI